MRCQKQHFCKRTKYIKGCIQPSLFLIKIMPQGWLVTLGWRGAMEWMPTVSHPGSRASGRRERREISLDDSFQLFVGLWEQARECCGHRDFKAGGGFIPVCLFNMREKFSCSWREGASGRERNGPWSKGLEEKVWRGEASFASDTTESVRRMLSKYLKRRAIITNNTKVLSQEKPDASESL